MSYNGSLVGYNYLILYLRIDAAGNYNIVINLRF